MVPVPAPTLSFLYGASARALQCAAHRLGRERAAANGVELAVIGFRDEGVDGANVGETGLLQHPSDEGIRCFPDAKRAGQQNRRLELAELHDLRRSQKLAEAVGDVDGGWDPLRKEIAGVGEHGRDAGANPFAFHDRRVPHAHARYIGDGIERAGAKNTRCNTELARSHRRSRLRGRCRDHRQHEEHGNRREAPDDPCEGEGALHADARDGTRAAPAVATFRPARDSLGAEVGPPTCPRRAGRIER